jgi:hypothetical protein
MLTPGQCSPGLAKSRIGLTTPLLKAGMLRLIALICISSTQALAGPDGNSVAVEVALPQIDFSAISKYIDVYNIRWGSKDEALEISGLRGDQSNYYETQQPILFELKIKDNLPGENATIYSLVGVGIVLDREKLKCGEAALFTRPKYNIWQIGAPGKGAIVMHGSAECKANLISFETR